MKRVGRDNDGGYVITELPGEYDLFLSGGIANDITFETQFLNNHPSIACYAFDGTISSLPWKNDKINFIKKNLGNVNTDEITDLHEYMKEYNNIFMKIDIEGHEFKLLPTFFENNYINKVKQLVLEIHSPVEIETHPNYFRGLSDIKNEHMFDLFTNINKSHTLIHFHGNTACGMNNIDGINIPRVFELTYIRNDFIDEKIQNDKPLPTELDMLNVVNNQDCVLSGFPYSL
jgi:hypothetical protein